MNWPEVPFENLYAVPSRNGVYKPKEFHGRGCRIVNMGELFGFDFISNQEMNRVELNDSELLANSLMDGDLLFGRRSLIESGAGKCSVVVEPQEDLTFESSVIRVRLNKNKANPLFFYYFFRSPQGKGRIGSIVTGTNVKGIRGSELKRLSVVCPKMDNQNEIVSTLFTYDSLIRNNIQRMGLLEETARLLYREWFVNLRFPGHEHTKIIKGVPEGWNHKVLGELCREIRDLVKPESLDPNTPYIGLEHMPRRSISLCEWGRVEEVTSTKHRFKEGEILFGKIRPYFHKVGIAFFDGVASSDAIIIRAEADKVSEYVLMTVSSDGFVAATAQTMKEGSKMPRADWKQMQDYLTPLPPDGILTSFQSVVRPILQQLKTLTFSTNQLRQARDLLLPKLMSGEITV